MTDGSIPSRRDFLRLAAAAGLIGPAGFSCSTPAPPPEPAKFDAVGMGLSALADVHKRGWVPGHHGAAVLAAHYFCLDNALDERAARAVRANVEAYVAFNREEFPAPKPGSGSADPRRLVEVLDGQITALRSGGHNAIYASLILRGLRDRPEFATPSIVDGACRLLDVFGRTSNLVRRTEYDIEHPMTAYRDSKDLTGATLHAILRPWSHVRKVG